MDRARWGFIGLGGIAEAFAYGLRQSRTGVLHAVAARDAARARAFAERHGARAAYGSYDDLLNDGDVSIVYIATPHPMHLEWVLKAAASGKHILVEKPMTINALQAEKAVESVRSAGVFMMEGFMYRCHPQTILIRSAVESGAVGEVKAVDASFAGRSSFNPASRLWNRELGGGGILDIGVYPVSMARMIAGAAQGMRFANPVSLKAEGMLHPVSGVDCTTSAVMAFNGGIIATAHTSIVAGRENSVTVYGSEGTMKVRDPWVCARTGGQPGSIELRSAKGVVETRDVQSDVTSFALEADVCGEAIAAGRTQADIHPASMTWDDTLGNMRTCDAWRAAIGLDYGALESA